MKYTLVILYLTAISLAYGDGNFFESYTPNYRYGSQPLGTYIGGVSDGYYRGIFVPNAGVTQYYYPQSGLPQEMSQFLQGQEQLMLSNSIEEQKRKLREKEIENKLLEQYQQQINNQ
jgi:hypothetical protein